MVIVTNKDGKIEINFETINTTYKIIARVQGDVKDGRFNLH